MTPTFMHTGASTPKCRSCSTLSDADISRIVEMAWEDRTSFDAIEAQFGLNESAVVGNL